MALSFWYDHENGVSTQVFTDGIDTHLSAPTSVAFFVV